jgi:hypothetical protein
MHRGACALGCYQTGLAKNPEVLGSVGLFEAAGAVDVAHAARAGAQTVEDAQTGRVGERGKEGSHTVHLALIDGSHGELIALLYYQTVIYQVEK